MTTMVKVAQLAGVSISTVSHVLNGTRHVGDETRQRVLKAIEETSYRQDALARAMRRSRTDSIGLIVSDGGEPAFAEMIRGVEETAANQGITLLLANSAEDPQREARAVQALLERRVDGLILARAAGSGPEALAEFANQDTPLVLMDRLSDDPFDQVGVENTRAHQGTGGAPHVAGPSSGSCWSPGTPGLSTLQERHDAFQEAMTAAGIPPSDQLTVTAAGPAETDAGIEDALSAAAPPTAVIACSTVLAAAALRRIQQRGLRMPEDIAFAAFDGFAYADLFEPQLTTVRQPAFQVGATAAELLTQSIADKSAETLRCPAGADDRIPGLDRPHPGLLNRPERERTLEAPAFGASSVRSRFQLLRRRRTGRGVRRRTDRGRRHDFQNLSCDPLHIETFVSTIETFAQSFR